MNKLRSLPKFLVFYEVSKQGSFTLAAEQLGMTKSAISQHITQLEQTLDIQLFNRTTRCLNLTDAGERFYGHCQKIKSQMDQAFDEIQDLTHSPQGVLTVTAPHALELDVIVPTLSEYCKKLPNILPDVIIDDAPMDLLKNNIDIALYVGHPKDSSYKAKILGQMEDILCASPSYLEQHPEIKTIADLNDHNWVITTWQQAKPNVILKAPDVNVEMLETRFSIPQGFKANTLPTALNFIEQGFGIGMLPSIFCKRSIEEGKLIRILPNTLCTVWPIYAVHSYQGKVPKQVRSFIDLAQENIRKTF